jgi:hypothetical protein
LGLPKIVRAIPEMRNNPEVIAERRIYTEWYLNLNPQVRYRNVIYIDESPFDLHIKGIMVIVLEV